MKTGRKARGQFIKGCAKDFLDQSKYGRFKGGRFKVSSASNKKLATVTMASYYDKRPLWKHFALCLSTQIGYGKSVAESAESCSLIIASSTGCPAKNYIQLGRSISKIFIWQKLSNITIQNTLTSRIMITTNFFY